MCSTNTERIGNCTVQYGKDPFYQNLSAPVIGPVNLLFPIVDIETSTTYYHKASVMINSSLKIIIKSVDTFITEDDVHSTTSAMSPSMAATSHPPPFPMNSSPAVKNGVTLKIYQLGLVVFVVIILILLTLGTAIIIIVLLIQKGSNALHRHKSKFSFDKLLNLKSKVQYELLLYAIELVLTLTSY